MNRTIDREAHDKAKGFRFQKLRAVQLILTSIVKSEGAYIYCAIENIGDVHLRTSSEAGATQYIEEDKDYKENAIFTLNTEEVLKSLVAFIDGWNKFDLSQSLYFGFCTTANIGKDKECERTKELAITLPDTPLLETIKNANQITDEPLSLIKKILIAAYKEQYAKHKFNGYIDAIEQWDNRTWLNFLGRITWYYGQANEKELEDEAVELLKQCHFYGPRLYEKERLLVSIIVDEFDKKQNHADPAERFIHASQVHLKAKLVEAGEHRISDPAWKMWKNLPPPDDTRNLIDKVRSATNSFDEKLLDSWCRAVALSRYEQDELKNDKNVIALKYRLFQCCYDKLLKTAAVRHTLSQTDLEQVINELTLLAISQVESLSRDFKYPLTSEQSLRSMILELADSCFLAFDMEKI